MKEQAISRKGTQKRQFPVWKLHIAPSRPVRPRRTRFNAITAAMDALFPWSGDRTGLDGKAFPGLYASLRAIANGRAKIETMRQWIKGRRGAPNWFVATLRDRLVQRRAEIDAAIIGLDQLPERPGHGAGLKQYWRDKKRREIEEQTARERKAMRQSLQPPSNPSK